MKQPDLKSETDFMKYYRDNPVKFFTQCLDVKPEYVWSKMLDVIHSVQHNQWTAVKAGHSVSKSYTLARLALWFLYTRYPSTVITTAPSNPQVEEILWREIRNAHANAKVPLGGNVTNTKIELAEKWFAYGFATKPDTVTQQVTRFQGFHNDNVLVIFDEAAGILKQIWEAKDSLISTPRHKFVAIGNPTTARGDFPDCFKEAKFSKITISVKDTPNYKLGKEIIPGLSGREFEETIATKYGVESNIYKARITGEIPDEDVDSLIPLTWIEKAEEREEVDYNFRFVKKFVTWDVADGGDDAHIIKAWNNTTETECVELRGKKVEEAEPYVWRLLRKIQGNCIIVDADGIGRVAVSLLDQSCDRETTIIPFEGSSKEVNEPNNFMNRRHEAHWKMREMFEKGNISISKDPEQREELASIKMVDHTKGYIAIERKQDLKDRLGRSPDKADAIMMMCGCFDDVPILEQKEARYKRTQSEKDAYPFTPATV